MKTRIESMLADGVDLAAIATILKCPFSAVVAAKRGMVKRKAEEREEAVSKVVKIPSGQDRLTHSTIWDRAARERAASLDGKAEEYGVRTIQPSPRCIPAVCHCDE
jgi:hypothetical protein